MKILFDGVRKVNLEDVLEQIKNYHILINTNFEEAKSILKLEHRNNEKVKICDTYTKNKTMEEIALFNNYTKMLEEIYKYLKYDNIDDKALESELNYYTKIITNNINSLKNVEE